MVMDIAWIVPMFGENLSPVSAREKALVEAENMDKTIVEEGPKDQIFWLIHNTPGIDYIIAGKIDAQHFKPEKLMNSKGEITGIQIVLEPSLEVEATLHLAVVTSRESDNLIKDANNLLEGSSWEEDTKTHLAWWRSFWSKSFIQIPDKLMENLWYCGLNNLACASRSETASSFSGLYQMLDLRPWYGCYHADGQIEMLGLSTFTTNHLEFLYPHHNTFASLVPEFIEHMGMLQVPHLFFPLWAGGIKFFGSHTFTAKVQTRGLP